MHERRYSRYTRAKTWAALYTQHIAACYALVPYSATNNSIAVIRCKSPEETQATMSELLKQAPECERFYSSRQTLDKAPAILAKARHAVVLAKSSDYYHYHLADHIEFALIVCGLHDSYLHLPVWEIRTNRRYGPRETAVAITSPNYARLRSTQFGHMILLTAYAAGDPDAHTFVKTLPPRTQRRINQEKIHLQESRYRGRPLAFLTEAERSAIGQKIAAGLRRYHEQKRKRAI